MLMLTPRMKVDNSDGKTWQTSCSKSVVDGSRAYQAMLGGKCRVEPGSRMMVDETCEEICISYGHRSIRGRTAVTLPCIWEIFHVDREYGVCHPRPAGWSAQTAMCRREREDNLSKLSSCSREFSVRSGVLPWHALLLNSRSLLRDRRD